MKNKKKTKNPTTRTIGTETLYCIYLIIIALNIRKKKKNTQKQNNQIELDANVSLFNA